MKGRCDYCGEVKRISKKTRFCAACVGQFNQTLNKYFDGDPLAPLKYAAAAMTKLSLVALRRASREKGDGK